MAQGIRYSDCFCAMGKGVCKGGRPCKSTLDRKKKNGRKTKKDGTACKGGYCRGRPPGQKCFMQGSYKSKASKSEFRYFKKNPYKRCVMYIDKVGRPPAKTDKICDEYQKTDTQKKRCKRYIPAWVKDVRDQI